MTLSKIVPSILGVCSVTLTFLAKVPSIPSINKANPNHKIAPTASLFKIAIIAKNPKTAPEPVNPCTAQAAILFLSICLNVLLGQGSLLIFFLDYSDSK